MSQIAKNLSKALVLVPLLACLASLPAQAFDEAQFQKVYQQFAGNGNEEETANAFKDLLSKEPGHPLLMAYAGASTTKLATTTMLPWKKMAFAEEGLAMIDKALQLSANSDPAAMHGAVPQAFEVKLVSASTFLAVPDFMNRGTRGQTLLKEIIENKQFEQCPVSFKGAVWIRAANTAIKKNEIDDAKNIWR